MVKRILSLLLLIALSLTLFVGCGKQEPAPQPDVPDIQEGGEIQENITPAVTPALAVEQEKSFDPYSATSACNRLVLEFVLEPLFTVKATGEVTPVLAEGYTVSPDGRTTTVTLKKNVKFHDGTALTSQQVVSSVQRAQSGSYYASRFYALTEVTATDSHTVTFTTEKAYECFPLLLDIPITLDNSARPVGTGQFRFQEDRLLAFADWWGAARVTDQEEILLHPVTNANQLREAFQYGTVLALLIDPNADGAPQNLWNYELWGISTASMQYLGFNLNRGVFQSRRLRQAVSRAVDRSTIVAEDMGGFGTPAVLPTRPDSIWDNPTLAEGCGYQPENLTDIVPAGLSATMIVCKDSERRVQSATRVAQELTARGLNTTVNALSREAYLSALQNGNFDLYYAEVKLPPNLDLSAFFREDGFAFGGLASAEGLTDLCDLALSNRGNAYDLQEAILQEGLLCPVAFKTTALYIQRNTLSGIDPNLGSWIFQ